MSNLGQQPEVLQTAPVAMPGHLPQQYFAAPAAQAEGEGEQGGSDLLQYWRILNRHKGIVVLAALIGVVFAVLATIPQTPVYQSSATVEVQDTNKDFVKQIGPVSDPSSFNATGDVNTQIRIMQSSTLISRVVQKLAAAPEEEPADQTTKGFFRKLLGNKKKVRAGSNLRIRALPQSRIVEISYDSTDPVYAADFINTLTAEYISFNMEARVKMNQQATEWMNKQVEDLRIKLERSEDALQQYASRVGLVLAGKDGSASEERLRQLQGPLVTAQTERALAQSRYEVAKTTSIDALPDVITDPSLRGLLDKITELKREEAELSPTYTPKHEKIQRIRAQIAPLEAAFAQARAAIVERIKAEYEAAVRREKLIQSEYGSQSSLVSGDSEKMIQYNILKRESDSNRLLYDAMLTKVNEAGVSSALQASNVRVLDPAKPPSRPYKPDFVMNAMMGLLAGIIFGIAGVIMRDRADRTIQQPGDIQYWTTLNELGAIPSAASEFANRVYGARRSDGEEEPALPGVELMTWNRRPSQVAEAFRGVLTSILFAGENGYPPKVLVMTSGVPKEGKTTVSTNLSIALSEIRRKVLLVDADLRKPRMHDLFRLPNTRGLSNLLEEYPLTTEMIEECIHETAVPNLYVMPSGPSTHRAANLLYSPNFPDLVAYFRKHYDMVVIDTPPMLAMTDSRVAARVADGVILVMRAGKTARDAAIAMRKRFAEDNTRVIGAILNDWNPKHSRNGYYGAYGGYAYDSYKSYYTATTSDDEQPERPRRRPAQKPKAEPRVEKPEIVESKSSPVAQGTARERIARLRAKKGLPEVVERPIVQQRVDPAPEPPKPAITTVIAPKENPKPVAAPIARPISIQEARPIKPVARETETQPSVAPGLDRLLARSSGSVRGQRPGAVRHVAPLRHKAPAA